MNVMLFFIERRVLIIFSIIFLLIGFIVYPSITQAAGASLLYTGPNSYNTSSASFTSSFSAATQDPAIAGVSFNNDGTKMYIVGSDNASIYEYNLSTPYSVQTGSFVGLFSVSLQDAFPTGMSFNNDGTKMYIVGTEKSNINEYSLSTPYSIQTGSFVGLFSVATQDLGPQDLTFNNNGTSVYIVGSDSGSIYQYSLSTPYSIQTGSFVGSFSVATQDTSPTGIIFNNDGTNVYIIGPNSNSVHKYSLSTPYSIQTGSFVDSFSVASQDNYFTGIAFNNNGTKMYALGDTNSVIFEYNINLGNYSEATLNDGSINNTNILSIQLSNDTFSGINANGFLQVGTDVIIGNVPAGLTPVMTLSNANSVASLTFTGNATAHLNANDIADLTFVFNDSAFTGGNASIVANSGSAGAYSSNVGIDFQNQISIAYSGTGFTETLVNDGAVSGSIITTIVTNTADTFQSILNIGTDVIVNDIPTGLTPVINLSAGNTVATLTLTGNATSHLSVDDIANISFIFNDSAFTNGVALNVTNSGSSGAYNTNKGINFLDLPILNYIGSNSYNTSSASFTSSFSVASQDTRPTGIAFSNDGTKMYVVGDQNNSIYEYSLSTPYSVQTGSFVGSFSVASQETWPTGIAFNNDGTKMYVVGNNSSIIYEYSLSIPYSVQTGSFVDSFSVSMQDTNPMGMSFNDDGTKMYVVGTSNNNVYEYNLSTPYSVQTGSFVGSFSVVSQDIFPTGIILNYDGTKMYVVGNNNNNIYEYNLSTPYSVQTGSFVGSFSVVSQETWPTGMSFNNDGTKMYVTGRMNSKIYEYDINLGNYPETTLNDGSINNTNTLSVQLSNGAFSGINANGFLQVGTDVIIGNVPAGLTPVMTLSNANSVASLTFTGNATAHLNANDIADLTFVFNDSAFVNGDASVVVRSGNTGAYSSNVGIDFSDTTVSYSSKIFSETVNDGSISSVLNVTLSGDTFATVGTLTGGGVDFTANNVPAGLTAVITTTSATTGTIALTGNATNYLNVPDVLNLEIIWSDAAFTNGTAVNVINSTTSNFIVDFMISPKIGSNTVNSANKTYSVTVNAPNGSETLQAGDTTDITWSTGGTGTTNYVNIEYSIDGGSTYTMIATAELNDGTYTWTIPSVASSQVMVRVSGTDLLNVVASDESDATFSIGATTTTTPTPTTTTTPTPTTTTPAVTEPSTGNTGASPVTGQQEEISVVNAGDYIRGTSLSAVYFVDENMIRHPFMNTRTFFTWQNSFDVVKTVTDATLTTLELGVPSLPKHGTVLVKIQSNPKVYAVEFNEIQSFVPVLRWISSESVATELYGTDWADYVVDVDVSLFSRFQFGTDIITAGDITVDRTIMKRRIDL